MAKKMLIDATHAEETRVVVVDGNKVEEFDFESENKRQLAGNIYLAKVTRVEPSLQAAFVDYGGNRHGFLAFSEIHPDYYQIPVADREALLAEEMEFAKEQAEEDEKPKKATRSRRGRGRGKAAAAKTDDAVVTAEVEEPANDDTNAEGNDVAEAVAPATDAQSEADEMAKAQTAEVIADIPGMDVVDLEGEAAPEDDTADDASENDGTEAPDEDEPVNAAARDENVESVGDDVTEEVRAPRRQRARKYKIQEVIKVRQILLVQVVKEERGNKGAALTTYLSLAGRYCVLMPNTARGGGISRKITNAPDRKKLKEIASEIDVPKGAGLIIRTAGSQRTRTEIKRDYEYLQRLWEQIRELTLKSTAPTQIYEEGNLIKRSIRDLYNREIDEVLVEGAEGYKMAKDFMKMIMPSHAKNVKLYADPQPLFARYQVETYLGAMFNPTVQLPSGGYIVIGVTEALVAIDVNSGRATKEGSIEQTALKTNLEASDEVARQLRLRDLAGLIVIDYIDMDERKNNTAVEKRFKDKLKTDRARIQVGRISAFGLLEMSRQRLRPGMIEATTQPCSHCHGTGLLRSDDSLSLAILRQLEEEGVRRRSREVLVKAPVAFANYLMNQKREHVAQIEVRYGMAVRIEGDPALVSPDFSVEKFKTATRNVKAVSAAVVSVDASLMDDFDDAVDLVADEASAAPGAPDEPSAEEGQPKKRRRRRRRGRGRGNSGENRDGDASGNDNRDSNARQQAGDAAQSADGDAKPAEAAEGAEGGDAPADEAPKKRTATRSRSRAAKPKANGAAAADVTQGDGDIAVAAPSEAPAAETPEAEAPAPEADVAEKPKRKTRSRAKKAAEPEVTADAADAAATEQAAEVAAAPVAKVAADDSKPKRKGWWSLGR
ncbi:MAG: Rne/Rng family ribonuclease [Rhodobacteraceae bacterium]|nr:Rne/Rng family ribonuclease [Paracoccaceae bacterium]